MKRKEHHEKEERAWGHGEHANMPQEVKMSYYPKDTYHADEKIDDTDRRIESDEKQAGHGFRRSLDRGMY